MRCGSSDQAVTVVDRTVERLHSGYSVQAIDLLRVDGCDREGALQCCPRALRA